MEKPLRCVICDVDIPNKESVGLHLLGKRHLRTLNFCKQKKDAEEKGIFVKGLSIFLIYFCCGHKYSIKPDKCM